MTDVTAQQFQTDVNDVSEWNNGGINHTQTFRLGQTADSPAKLINDINNRGNAAINELNKSRGFRVRGTFAAGFTYELPNDVGADASGNHWTLSNPDNLPFTVPAGTTPTNPVYEQVTFSDLQSLTGLTDVSGLNSTLSRKVTRAQAALDSPTDGARYELIDEALAENIFAGGSLSRVVTGQLSETVNIPSDYATLQDAINMYDSPVTKAKHSLIINIESGHELTSGLRLTGGDYSSIKITSDDATVSLADGFTGADTSGIPAGILGETPRQPLLCAYKAKCPEWDIVVDMGNQYGTGHQLCESEIVVNPLKGVINAGFRGIQVHGRANIYQANYNGASGSGIRLQQASSCVARSATANNCCSTEDLATSSVYASRSSLLEFRGGSAQNSGASGLIARRSKVTADEANFNGSTSRGVQAENEAEVSFANGFALNCGSSAIRSIANAKVYAVGTQSSTTSSAQNLNVDVGGVITIASSNQIEGGTGEANALSQSNVSYFNAFDEAGMIFYDASNGTFKIESDSNGIIQKFADGRMLSFINTSIDTGTVTSGSFSAQLNMPTQPATTAFVSVDGSSMDVIGRSTTGGGGTRICVRHYYRPTVLTGSAFRIENTGQQLDGAGTGQNVQSVNVSMITYGTWR